LSIGEKKKKQLKQPKGGHEKRFSEAKKQEWTRGRDNLFNKKGRVLAKGKIHSPKLRTWGGRAGEQKVFEREAKRANLQN